MFTGCSGSDDAVAENNPKYNATTGEVGVDFVMNVSSSSGTTRMSSANTQASAAENFRGINNALLATFKQAEDGKIISTAATADKTYNMGEILGSGALDPDGTGSTPKSRRVIELALPTGTNTLMFWGKAIKNGTDANVFMRNMIMESKKKGSAFIQNRQAETAPAKNVAAGAPETDTGDGTAEDAAAKQIAEYAKEMAASGNGMY